MLLLKGTVMGVKVVDGRPNPDSGEIKQRHFVGVSVPKHNGYKGETITYDVQITKAQMPKGVAAHYEKIKGQEVFVPVLAMSWAGKNGNSGINWFLGDDGLPKNSSKPATA